MGTIPRVWSAKLAAALSLGGGGVPQRCPLRKAPPLLLGSFPASEEDQKC